MSVTDLARALVALKENADEAGAHKMEIDQLNGWFEIALHKIRLHDTSLGTWSSNWASQSGQSSRLGTSAKGQKLTFAAHEADVSSGPKAVIPAIIEDRSKE